MKILKCLMIFVLTFAIGVFSFSNVEAAIVSGNSPPKIEMKNNSNCNSQQLDVFSLNIAFSTTRVAKAELIGFSKVKRPFDVTTLHKYKKNVGLDVTKWNTFERPPKNNSANIIQRKETFYQLE